MREKYVFQRLTSVFVVSVVACNPGQEIKPELPLVCFVVFSMTKTVYVIHDTVPAEIPSLVSELVTKVSAFYRFLGVEEANLSVKQFRHSTSVSGILFCSPSPKVSIDFSAGTSITVTARNVNLESVFS